MPIIPRRKVRSPDAKRETHAGKERERDVRTSGNGRTEEVWILKIEGIA